MDACMSTSGKHVWRLKTESRFGFLICWWECSGCGQLVAGPMKRIQPATEGSQQAGHGAE